jgi:carbohydrate-binding DOMON domain-containing protein
MCKALSLKLKHAVSLTHTHTHTYTHTHTHTRTHTHTHTHIHTPEARDDVQGPFLVRVGGVTPLAGVAGRNVAGPWQHRSRVQAQPAVLPCGWVGV